MAELLTIADGYPRRQLQPRDVLIVDGEPVRELFVLVSGNLRIEKHGSLIATVVEPGACVGEMSLLLGIPATADVVAGERSELAVIDDAGTMLDGGDGLPLVLARLLARRLQVMTTYLADIKQQYADHEGGLGMVDTVLGTLMQTAAPRSELGFGAGSRSRVLEATRASYAPASVRSSTPSDEDHRTVPVSVSTSMCGGTGPISRPEFSTNVEPIRSIQLPSGANGDSCTCPQMTMSGPKRSIHAPSSSSP